MKVLPIAATLLAATFAVSASAEGDLSRQNVITVNLEMGSNDDGMYFSPNNFVFETGQAYNLVMTNVDEIKHEVSFNEMLEKIFVRKVEAHDKDGNLVTEVKGAIYEAEIGAGQTVEYFFVPVQPLEDAEITCEIPGHYESGMHAKVTIK